jgi:hypothetical protein
MQKCPTVACPIAHIATWGMQGALPPPPIWYASVKSLVFFAFFSIIGHHL